MTISLLERHFDEAAFLFGQRAFAVRAANQDLRSLGVLDERIEAQLDGLRLGGAAAWELCLARCAEDAGTAFTAASLALHRDDLEAFALVLELCAGARALAHGLVGALEWAPFERIRAPLQRMMSAASPSHYRRIALAACEMRRFDPGRALDAALGEGVDPDVRAASVMTAGVLGRAERLPALRVAFAAPEAPVRHAAAWSAALLGDPGAPLFLWELAQRDAAFLLMSCELLALLPPPAGGRDPSGMPLRMGFRYAAASGDVRHVPWLLEGLADAQAARGAAEAVTTLTGADFARPPLLGTPPASFTPTPNDDPADENVALDPDECLPWPDARTARLFWDERASSFAPDARYLLGRATEEAWLGDVLRIGCQGQRALAALRLKLSHVGRPLFNVRAPVARQRKALGLEA